MDKNYRNVWEEAHGKIPLDEDGRTYEIHHIDGNRKNNDISNLMCLSIREHYNIHFEQGDYYACASILKRINLTEEEKQDLSSKISEANKSRPNPMDFLENRIKVSESLKGKYVGEKHHGFGKKRPEHSEKMKGNEFYKCVSEENLEKKNKIWTENNKKNPIRAKEWQIEFNGIITKIKNLKKFCRDNNLCYRKIFSISGDGGYKLVGI